MRRWLATLVREAWSLFVDDLGLAIGALAAVLVTAALVHGGQAVLAGPLLFVGLVASLLFSVWRRARRRE